MVKESVYIILLLVLSGCMESGESTASRQSIAPATAPGLEVPPQSDRTFVAGERVGLITPGMPMSRIENLYGSDQLVSREIDAGEGTTQPGYILFPATHDELYIELGPDKQPERARFSDGRSNWRHASTGLSIGTTLHELKEMNGKPFHFTGFGWDYGGTVTDWQGGELEDILVRLTYAPERVSPQALPDSLYGDTLISSEVESIQHIGLKVREISVPIGPTKEE